MFKIINYGKIWWNFGWFRHCLGSISQEGVKAFGGKTMGVTKADMMLSEKVCAFLGHWWEEEEKEKEEEEEEGKAIITLHNIVRKKERERERESLDWFGLHVFVFLWEARPMNKNSWHTDNGTMATYSTLFSCDICRLKGKNFLYNPWLAKNPGNF